MQPCDQADNIQKLSDYTGMNPMTNGKSLRGQIESLREMFRRSINRQNLLFVVISTIIITLVVASYWASRNDASTVMNAARQISLVAESIKDTQPLSK